eukprot:CAMPEP_0114590424 /NCGR_PEP_ID=MMETSP0125-20121206/12693_1 /TAXON_ID=485358 ORGANISM="Aristerostoma sp., Strain ATCC 50986" /NCGR_SAMPLE_ID=MMETSP0125 /ASSEMBLY_ACC=CAM_ASM_000245 /LENGTH=103 /DNA_ID=CAMNT_0001787939 /DNA_START=347 /DNA_END=658 /DNA_ORIENTATION=+
MKNDEKTGWTYMAMAMFYSLCTPFGYEMDIRQQFVDYVYAMNDDLTLKETIKLLKSSEDPVLKRHKQVIVETMYYFFDQNLTNEQRISKFRSSLFGLAEHIDE